MKSTRQQGFIIPLIIVIVALGIGFFAYKHHVASVPAVQSTTEDNASVSADTNTSATAEDSGSVSSNANGSASTETDGTFASLMTGSGARKCTVSFNAGGSTSSTGTFYVANGTMRGDFIAQSSGHSFNVHVIMKDQTAYTWMDGVAMGFKASLSGSAKPAGTSSSAPSFSADQKVQYICEPWTLDSSLLALPAGVSFAGSAATGASTGY